MKPKFIKSCAYVAATAIPYLEKGDTETATMIVDSAMGHLIIAQGDTSSSDDTEVMYKCIFAMLNIYGIPNDVMEKLAIDSVRVEYTQELLKRATDVEATFLKKFKTFVAGKVN